jgi:uncharacterized protein YfaP (DUF2135 family)
MRTSMRPLLRLLAPTALVAASAFALAPRGAASPPQSLAVRILAPFGGMTSERVVTVRGRVEGPAVERLTLVVNGTPLSVAISGGNFEQPQVLGPGLNTIRAVVERDGVVAEDSVALYAQVPAKDLRISLTWDTPGTDVDLWVTSPDGEKVLYSHREGKAGGILDTDVTSGFGPETYTQARLVRGTFRIQAHAYRIDRPTRVEVTTVRFEGTPDEERRVLRGVLLRTGDVIEVGEVVVR